MTVEVLFPENQTSHVTVVFVGAQFQESKFFLKRFSYPYFWELELRFGTLFGVVCWNMSSC